MNESCPHLTAGLCSICVELAVAKTALAVAKTKLANYEEMLNRLREVPR